VTNLWREMKCGLVNDNSVLNVDCGATCIFQVQLVKCLDKSRQAAPLRCRQQKCPGSPVVRPAVVEPGCGMLTERQMAWVDELPHEATIENPVLHKCVV